MSRVKYILASRSPRRKELLSKIVDEFEIITRETDESLPDGVHPKEGVELLAVRKGKAVADEISPDFLIISSDTLVELGGVPLGKPIDENDAVSMLLTLSGKSHNVHTGVAIHYKGKVFSGSDTSRVIFKSFGENASGSGLITSSLATSVKTLLSDKPCSKCSLKIIFLFTRDKYGICASSSISYVRDGERPIAWDNCGTVTTSGKA